MSNSIRGNTSNNRRPPPINTGTWSVYGRVRKPIRV
jgi:hypothetical protein